MESRKADVSIKYNGKDATKDISDYLKSFNYTDVASGASDSISIRLTNKDKKWMMKWMPKQGDKILPKIITKNWNSDTDKNTFKCGSFVVDDFGFSGYPLEAEINALSVPVSEGFSVRERSKTWTNETVKTIAAEIAKRASIALVYEAGNITIKKIEQSKQADCDFLFRLCESYGLAMKVYSNKIIIFNEETYEKKKSIATVKEADLLTWEYNTTTAKTYTGGKLQYTDAATKKDITVSVGEGKRILNVNERADSIKDAELKLKAKIRNANKKITTMRITIMANPKIIASSNINIKGLEKLDGKYAVDEVKHTIGNGYTMTLNLRSIKSASAEKKKDGTTEKAEEQYTIKSGDTLTAISKNFLGSGAKYMEIYNANKDVIEAAAKKHGKTSSNNGQWIYPGTVLTIP